MDGKKTRAAFEKWYSDNGEWTNAVERNSRGEYKYAGAAVAWPVLEAATKHAETEVIALLADAEVALRDLHACADENCTEPNCLHVLPRVRALLAER